MTLRQVMTKRIREWRAKRKLSQRELAERSGVSREYIARLELGQHDPTVGTLEKLAKALGVPVSALLDAPAATEKPRKGRGRRSTR